MDIQKESRVSGGGIATAVQMEAINAQAHSTLTPEQVYVFSVRLCDDQLDRDLEKFDTGALPGLAKLFVGKTGIVDHHWSSDRQVARIFATEVVQQELASFIKAWAYIRRGGEADEVIADIEAGIKKEVSVGCSMARRICSVCGQEYGSCGHRKGQYYDGILCCAILQEPVDAYEFSFVAVPAQPEAGVIKGIGSRNGDLKGLAEKFGAQAEYRALHQQAQMGKRYEKQLRDGVVRLGLCLDLGMEEPLLRKMAEAMTGEDLEAMQLALEKKMQLLTPLQPQLPGLRKSESTVEAGFLI